MDMDAGLGNHMHFAKTFKAIGRQHFNIVFCNQNNCMQPPFRGRRLMLSSRPVMKDRKPNPLQPVCKVFMHLFVIKSSVDMTVINSWRYYPHSEMHNLPVT